MTETSHTRSRRAAVFGLVLQLVVFAGTLTLVQVSHSFGMFALAFYVLGGVPLWFICLLAYRQHELVDLEALDLEELRREKRATGGSDAIFDEEGGGALGFRVAETRLRWMQRWLLPGFGLLSAIYLAAMGLYMWYTHRNFIGAVGQQPLVNLPLAMIVLAVMMLLLFWFSRYASGMGRTPAWQHLRACGSYMLGNAIGALALIVCLGVYLYADFATAERVLAYAIPVVMILLAAETLVNFVLDIYRPRVRDVEPRACFDSRLLALISEPGGIASTIAEAMNYQFGFEVSQTWFYQLLQRTFVPLLGAGAVILWLLTCVLVIQPGERVIVERWGRQINADNPYECGLRWKWPWPMDVARTYNTSELRQLIVGFSQFDGEPKEEEGEGGGVALWDDEKHMGQPHFDFLIPVPPFVEAELAPRMSGESGQPRSEQALPVNMVRMDVAIQYRIRDDQGGLAAYTQRMANAEDALRDIAWEEVVRYNAVSDIFTLLGEKYGTAGTELKDRISERLKELNLGLEVVYVGVQNVHPEPGVAKEFRKVITAEQEKIAAIREALVRENQILSEVAGDRDTAKALARAIDPINPNTSLLDRSELVLAAADQKLVSALQTRVSELKPLFTSVVETRWRLSLAQQDKRQVDYDFDLGLGQNVDDKTNAAERVVEAEAVVAEAEQKLTEALEPIRRDALKGLNEATFAALRDHAQARFALEFWNGRLDQLLPDVRGEASAILARAQAARWSKEMQTAAQVARMEGERGAYRAAPRVYKIRKYLEVLVQGIQDSRKFFLAFEPAGRQVRVRFIAEEEARAGIENLPTRQKP